MALSIDKVFEGATSGLTAFGDNLGTLARNAPLNIPFLPLGRKDAQGNRQPISIGQAASNLSLVSSASGRGGAAETIRQQFANGSQGNNSGSGTGPTSISISNQTNLAIDTAIREAPNNNNRLREEDIQAIAREVRRENPNNTNYQELAERIRTELSRSNYRLHDDDFNALVENIQNPQL